MNQRILRIVLAGVLIATGLTATSAPSAAGTATVAQATATYQKIGYFTQWGIYRRNFKVKNVHQSGMAAKLTHINYAFGNVGEDGRCFEANEAGVGDAWADYQKGFKANESVDGVKDVYNQPLAGNFNQLLKLKAMYPHLKVQISLGGWTWSKYFSDAALTPQSRAEMASSCIDLYLKGDLPIIGNSSRGGPGSGYGVFDGIDLDWEWPAWPGNEGNVIRPEDKQNYALLAAEFRRQLDEYGTQVGRYFSLTAFLPADPAAIDAGIDASLFDSLDFATVQGYDLAGAWNPDTGHQGNLHSTPQQEFSADLAIQTYLGLGAPTGKLVLGIPYYGRGWKGVNNENDGLYQPATGPARGTYENGVDDYKKVIGKSGTVFYDPVAGASWKFNGREFWSYDTPDVIAQKTAYIKSLGLGGSMVWSLDGDTSSAELTTAIHNGLG